MAQLRSSILNDLEDHLQNAKIPIDNLSTLAKQGNDKLAVYLDPDYSQLVERFLTDNIGITGNEINTLQSQLYIASFWGIKQIVRQLLALEEVDVNHQNPGTKWTSLHAATFQDHGPVVMLLLENGAKPEMEDSEGRTPKDFASTSDKVWPHFAAMGLQKTLHQELINKDVIRKITEPIASKPKQRIALAPYEYLESLDESTSGGVGDVLAHHVDTRATENRYEGGSIWK